MHIQQMAILLLVMAFVIYRRTQRTIGFQFFKPRRLIFRMILFTLIIIGFLANAALHPHTLFYAVPGILIGAVLVRYAALHSKFQWKNNELYYRTHKWIEATVLILFLGRFLYRFLILAGSSDWQSMQNMQYGQHFTTDPLTAFVFFILGTYYIGFNAYILKKGNGLKKEESPLHPEVL
ncbi:sporulation protein [Fictibacillus enclensis]|uniref:sporulation protein n=1 Tax=Fictibacillus enclensis TaxID=1017270 RepID=UPI00259FE6CE|nr:sporulation protein [Fictibacillus enclensis]MDM5198353.1 sporulation protein [Fictibacillus enclensis]